MSDHLVFSYKAVRMRQTSSSEWIILFGAPATEIDVWAGVPQKKEIGSQETAGFQRGENKNRIKKLEEFYNDESNIIQNPLLCSVRQTEQGKVIFEPDLSQAPQGYIQTGVLKIEAEKLEKLSLLELLRRVKSYLEKRIPSLVQEQIPDYLLISLKQRVQVRADFYGVDGDKLIEDMEEDEISDEDNEESEKSDDASAVFSDESHILDFWQEIAARVRLLEEIGASFSGEEFLDYSKDAMLSFLRPVIVVDGQHRLRGAVASAKRLSGKPPYQEMIENALMQGKEPEVVQKEVEAEAGRKLPISLLMNSDPAEHVFQFVVVNQKATPIGRALLGTIVSTSLSNDELNRVSERLEKAGIPLEESRSVAYLSRNPNSPFYGLVQRGLASDNQDRLQWNVLVSIVKVFQNLRGGKLFHERNDYADKWKRDFLPDSGIVSSWEEEGCKDAFEYWQRFDGPWRDVFIRFWQSVRDRLADYSNDQAWHYWGAPRQSNIFNKVSLTILAADFFQYLCDRRLCIDRPEDVQKHVEDWLHGVNQDYFNRDWRLQNVRKDSPGIRKQWAKLWVEYRKDPQRLPRVESYRLSMS